MLVGVMLMACLQCGRDGDSSEPSASPTAGGDDHTISGDSGDASAGDVAQRPAGDAGPVDEGGKPPADSRSTGCGTPGKTGSFHLTTTDGKGATRDYAVQVPSTYDAKTPLAVTFVYHGAGGNEQAAESFGLQDAAKTSSASIFVFPQGVEFENYGVGWDDSCGGYDMVFFDHMLEELEQQYCIDTARVFAAGFSWGCDYVTGLRCCRGSRLRAIAAASCADEFSNAADFKTYANMPCPDVGVAGIRFTHDAKGDGAYSQEQFTTTSALYRSFNACSATSTATSPSPCVSYQGCASPFVECAYPGLGHTLPENWASDTWDFFASFASVH
ncbi:Endo-1,4-beta-xylanase B precursor [Labilithrix luteola]|uniref:Endo-1,4-beta-xylanase B n=1 Tax=Labilithrix luteola TaxID=1391654 RepID=A0A0K1Q3A8_9BACT|nr:Endo-1,4-beta-xylanase B precursor [Labilithrix luteola]